MSRTSLEAEAPDLEADAPDVAAARRRLTFRA